VSLPNWAISSSVSWPSSMTSIYWLSSLVKSLSPLKEWLLAPCWYLPMWVGVPFLGGISGRYLHLPQVPGMDVKCPPFLYFLRDIQDWESGI
jgi:hypothetical protein